MAFILIDGYNLIGTAHHDLEKARNDIIGMLGNYAVLRGHEITVVFDGWKAGRATETRKSMANIHVIFSRMGENADFVIKRILSHDRRPWIVVSTDREIADFAHRKDLACVSAEEFEDRLHSVLSGTVTDSAAVLGTDEDDPGKAPLRRKGNPRRLSKKKKRKLQALRKL